MIEQSGTDQYGTWVAAPDQSERQHACKSCRLPIWFGRTFKKDGSRGAVSSHDVVEGVLTTRNHWSTCPKREEFRRLRA